MKRDRVMAEPIFDHEQLDVYRVSIAYVADSFDAARLRVGTQRHLRDQGLRAVQSIPLNIAEGNGKRSDQDKNRFLEIARGSALECGAVHDILLAAAVGDAESLQPGKAKRKRIVSMLTRLIGRTRAVTQFSDEDPAQPADAPSNHDHKAG